MEGALTATVRWTEKLHLEGKAPFDHTIPLDFDPPLGDGNGLRPMELVLISLAGCSGQTVVSLLQKMRQDVRAFTVEAVGTKVDDHPKVFSAIHLVFKVAGVGLDPAAVDKAVRYSEEKYCPVWAMMKQAVKVSSEVVLESA
ncbi:MAG: OsmC family protein [Candidatus Aminicenantes bacterium]|nr:OsmC family protein [Candidatus Aminicenantes bacterium]